MVGEPDNLVLRHLRELREEMREAVAGLRSELHETRDVLLLEMTDVKAEVRETRIALTGVGYLVNLHTGDVKNALDRFNERLERLEHERA